MISQRRETCKCGHDKASHHREASVDPDSNVLTTRWCNCLAAFCDCEHYEPPPQKDDAA